MKPRMRDVLRWVNRARKLMGLRPIKRLPKGVMDDPYSCPIGTALQGEVEVPDSAYGEAILIPFEEDAVIKLTTTPAVERFIEQFDLGEYPELIRD